MTDRQGAGLLDLPPLPEAGKAPRLTPLRRPPVRPTGPRIYHLQKKPELEFAGPGEPPDGFVTAHTSKTEWWIYWAIAKVLNDPVDPRRPPFVGGQDWSYQKAEEGGRIRGGQVLDFVVYAGNRAIGIRVETERYHIFTSAHNQAHDFYLKTHSAAVDRIVNVYDQDFMGDPTGRAACVVISEALKGEERGHPVQFGRGRRVR